MKREEKKRQTRMLLLATAETLFQAQGYDQVTTRAIAKAAGVAVGTLFAHFPDKHQLSCALFYERLAAEMAQISVPDEATALEFWGRFAAQLYPFYAKDRAFSIALLKQAIFDLNELQTLELELLEELARRLTVEAPQLNPESIQVVARAWFNAYLMHLTVGLGQPALPPEQWASALVQECQTLWSLVTAKL